METTPVKPKALIEIQKILHLMKERRFEQNEAVFHEGDEDRNLYIVLSGEIEISKKTSEGVDKVIAELTAGEILGEGVLSGVVVKPATARALTRVILLTLAKDDFDALLKEDPETGVDFLLSVMTAVNHRLNQTNIKLLALYELNKLMGQYQDDLVNLAKALIERLKAILESRDGILFIRNPFSNSYRVVYSTSPAMDESMLANFSFKKPHIASQGDSQFLFVPLKDAGIIILSRELGDKRYEDDELRLMAFVAEQAGNTIESASRRASDKARHILQQKKFTL
ncbi:cyclic nucleotide-binding domain-containing protein [Candidatus Peregrinibacteria bacterium]|nr:cyclic nucleotide-binding domain-containing protein [Candidatus Peregrinibacteria bacterium]